MAKKTGADALLQVGEYYWSAKPILTRFFVLDENSSAYREVSESEYAAWSGAKYSFGAQKLTFIGTLIDVETGEIMASFNIEAAANDSLPSDYSTEIDRNLVRVNESFPYLVIRHKTMQAVNKTVHAGKVMYSDYGTWYKKAVKKTQQKVIQLVVNDITGSNSVPDSIPVRAQEIPKVQKSVPIKSP